MITEDTPAGGPDELQWKIDRLIEQVQRHVAELQRERGMRNDLQKSLIEARERFDALTSRLTVGDLRKAGFTVDIKPRDVCDTCGEEY